MVKQQQFSYCPVWNAEDGHCTLTGRECEAVGILYDKKCVILNYNIKQIIEKYHMLFSEK
jgi:hypothetical protein